MQTQAVQTIRRRLPPAGEIFPVFSIFVFLIFSWALYRLFWYVPSWLEYLSIPSLLVIAAYTLAFNLIESLLMTAGLLIICLVLPARLFRQCFVPQGALVVLAAGAGAVLIQRQVSMIYDWEIWQVLAFPVAALAAVLLLIAFSAWLFSRFPRLAGWISAFADRMTIFSYLYVPVGVLSLLVVLFRNLFL